jgi:hypothetical protein
MQTVAWVELHSSGPEQVSIYRWESQSRRSFGGYLTGNRLHAASRYKHHNDKKQG